MAKFLCKKCGFGAVPFPTDDEITDDVYNFFHQIMKRKTAGFDPENSESDEDEQQRAHEEDMDQEPSDWFEHGELFGLRRLDEMVALTFPAPSALLALDDRQVGEDGDEDKNKRVADVEQKNKKEDDDSETESATENCEAMEKHEEYKNIKDGKKETGRIIHLLGDYVQILNS